MAEFQFTSEGKAAFEALKALDGTTIKVGWAGGMKTDEGKSQPKNGMERKSDGSIVQSPATLPEIALYNELGTSTIPARPFLKQAFENGADEIQSFIAEGLRKIAISGKVSQFLNLVGVKLVDVVQSEIENGSFAPNAPSTIRRKGSSHPLIDTATLKNTVGFQITKED